MRKSFKDIKKFIRIVSFLKSLWHIQLSMLLVTGANIFLVLLLPQFLRIIIDDAILKFNPELLIRMVAVYFGVSVLAVLFDMLFSYIATFFERKTYHTLQRHLLSHLLDIPFREFKNKTLGDILTRLHDDVNQIRRFTADILPGLFRSTIFLLMGSIFIFHMNLKLALPAFVALFLVPISFDMFKRKIRETSHWQKKSLAKNSTLLQEILGGFYIIKSFILKNYFLKKHKIIGDELVKSSVRLNLYESFGRVTGEGIIHVILIVWTLGFGGFLVLKKEITLGVLMAFQSYIRMLVSPVVTLLRTRIEFERIMASVDRLTEIFRIEKEKDISYIKKEINIKTTPLIVFDNVCFSYDGKRKILNNVSLSIYPYEKVAIVGPSGSGKTTLINLLMKHYHPTSGKIYLAGVELSALSSSLLRKMISIVPQDVFLFNDTIKENVKVGNPEATAEKIKRALSMAHCDFIGRLPEKENTFIGNEGIELSGGEKQRISIARALIRKSPIIIMDEPTSNIDLISEKHIISAIKELKNHTIIIITHKLSLAVHADRIILLFAGEITGEGTHETLLNTNKTYQRLWKTQILKHKKFSE